MEYRAEDKRKSKRVPYVECVVVNDSLEVHSNDISEGGLFVHMNKALQPGNVVSIKFPDTPVKFEAIVQVVPGTGGVGLMFTNMDNTHRAALKGIIEKVENAAVETTTGQQTATTTVLLVEGTDSLRKMNAKKLATEGFSVLEASDGMEALKILHTQTPDVVILELEVKRVDGYGVMEFMQSSPSLKDVPVLAVSSQVKSEDKPAVIEAGASLFLPKDTTSPARLASVLNKLLAKEKK